MRNTFTMLAIAMLFSALVTLAVSREGHLIGLDNLCGTGQPMVALDGQTPLSTPSKKESLVPFFGPQSGTVYLQTDDNRCGPNGENCAAVHFTLADPPAGCSEDDSSDCDSKVSIFAPPGSPFPIKYTYWNGCNGQSSVCADVATGCNIPPNGCEGHDLSILVTFCPN